jgi:hypothetical protein
MRLARLLPYGMLFVVLISCLIIYVLSKVAQWYAFGDDGEPILRDLGVLYQVPSPCLSVISHAKCQLRAVIHWKMLLGSRVGNQGWASSLEAKIMK